MFALLFFLLLMSHFRVPIANSFPYTQYLQMVIHIHNTYKWWSIHFLKSNVLYLEILQWFEITRFNCISRGQMIKNVTLPVLLLGFYPITAYRVISLCWSIKQTCSSIKDLKCRGNLIAMTMYRMLTIVFYHTKTTWIF